MCREFQIARTTLDDWLGWQAEGRLKPVVWSRGRQSSIDGEALRILVEQSSFATVKELQALYNTRFSPAVSRTRLDEALKRIGYPHKKDLELSSSQPNSSSGLSVVES